MIQHTRSKIHVTEDAEILIYKTQVQQKELAQGNQTQRQPHQKPTQTLAVALTIIH